MQNSLFEWSKLSRARGEESAKWKIKSRIGAMFESGASLEGEIMSSIVYRAGGEEECVESGGCLIRSILTRWTR